MKFWDASAIVPLLVRDAKTAFARRTLEDDRVQLVSWATRVECTSALARLGRTGSLSDDGVARALGLLEELAGDWREVQPAAEVRRRATRALLVHPLKAADAFQLASALVAAERGAASPFVSFDRGLRRAAAAEGFDVLPAQQQV